MANSITTTFLLNGSRNFVAKIDIVGDGSGEAAAVKVIDVANLVGSPTKFTIRDITWQFADFNAALLWDADTDVQAIALNQYEGDLHFFEDLGVPLANNAGAGVTGNLNLTTVGLGAGDRGTLIVRGYH